jgi:hypothetical protein
MIMQNTHSSVQPTDAETFVHDGHLKVFNHHVYEYRKGLRHLALQTLPRKHGRWVMTRLDDLGVAYLIYPAGKRHINVFLGDAECLEIVRQIGKLDLSRYSPEEDFILGIMLGYGRHQQCKRYLALLRDVQSREAHAREEATPVETRDSRCRSDRFDSCQ